MTDVRPSTAPAKGAPASTKVPAARPSTTADSGGGPRAEAPADPLAKRAGDAAAGAKTITTSRMDRAKAMRAGLESDTAAAWKTPVGERPVAFQRVAKVEKQAASTRAAFEQDAAAIAKDFNASKGKVDPLPLIPDAIQARLPGVAMSAPGRLEAGDIAHMDAKAFTELVERQDDPALRARLQGFASTQQDIHDAIAHLRETERQASGEVGKLAVPVLISEIVGAVAGTNAQPAN